MIENKCSLCKGEIDRTTMTCLSCGMRYSQEAAGGRKYIVRDDNRPQPKISDSKYSSIHNSKGRISPSLRYGECCGSGQRKGSKLTWIIIIICIIIITSIAMTIGTHLDFGETEFRIRDFEPGTGRRYYAKNYDLAAEASRFGMYETISTEFFDMEVRECAEVEPEDIGLPIYDSNKFVKVKIWIENTMKDAITMFDDDFAIHCGSNYVLPVSYMGLSEQLPGVYDLGKGEYAEGFLYFALPNDVREAELVYTEYYDDDSTGSTYYADLVFE